MWWLLWSGAANASAGLLGCCGRRPARAGRTASLRLLFLVGILRHDQRRALCMSGHGRSVQNRQRSRGKKRETKFGHMKSPAK